MWTVAQNSEIEAFSALNLFWPCMYWVKSMWLHDYWENVMLRFPNNLVYSLWLSNIMLYAYMGYEKRYHSVWLNVAKRRLWSFTKSQNMKKTEFITRRVTATWQVRYQLRHVNKLDIIVMFSMKFLFLEWVTNASELGIITRATRRYKKFI